METCKKALIIPLLIAVLLSFVSGTALVSGSNIFAVSFENPNNNFVQFDGTSGSGCTVQNSVAYSGSYSARLAIRGDSQYFFKNVPNTSTISVHFSLLLEDTELTQGDSLVFLTVYDVAFKPFSVVINMETAVPHWNVIDGLTGSSYTNSTSNVTLNTWNDLAFTVAKSADSNSEVLQLYVNGELTCKLTSTGNINGLNQVWFMGGQISNTINLYFDEITVDSEILAPPFPTPIPTSTPTPSPSPTATPTPPPTTVPTPSPSQVPTPTPSPSPSSSPVSTPSPTPDSTPLPSSSSPTPVPTSTTYTPSVSPTASPSLLPSPTPASTTTPTSSPKPSLTPAPTLAATPTFSPTPAPSSSPPYSSSTPEGSDSETTKSSQSFSDAILVLLVSVSASLTVIAYLLTRRSAASKKPKTSNSQFSKKFGKTENETYKSKRNSKPRISSGTELAENKSSSIVEDIKTSSQVNVLDPQRFESEDLNSVDESKKSATKSNGCPKNLDYFLLRPRSKQMPEECLTCPNLLKCVCLTEK